MGLMDELKKLTHPYSDRDDDDYDDYDDEPLDDEPEQEPAPRRTFGRSSAAAETARPAASSAAASRPLGGSSRVVNLGSSTQLQVNLVNPSRFDQVSDIADHLRDKQAIVLNLELTDKDVARRLVDFLSGCAYALDGRIKKVAKYTYLVTPYSVDVIGELAEELENNAPTYF